MNIEELLTHHAINKNPFAEEDAQTDPVFKEHCITSIYHPTWDKVYGDPAEPTTSIVFGEKGAGKTALRLQICQHLARHNSEHPGAKVYVIEYDDFNAFLDRFRDRLHGRKKRADRTVDQWRLWDHMDAILTLGVTQLTDALLESQEDTTVSGLSISAEQFDRLDRYQARDLLLLAASYDQSTAETFTGRWHRLRRRLKYRTLLTQWDLGLGIAGTVAIVALMISLAINSQWLWLGRLWIYAIMLAAVWAPWLVRFSKCILLARGMVKHVRIGNHQTNPLRRVLMQFSPNSLAGQPLPNKDRTDDRYELLHKFQGILKTLGYSGIIVLVDRVDEPHLINGSAELMRSLVWPMLDNKFLKQSGLGLKLLLPIELNQFVQRESREFFERARLDKQNMIPSLEWTGEALYDVANARIRACSEPGSTVTIRSLLDESISQQRLFEALRSLRVPRHLFKFLYRLLVAHTNAHTSEQPAWTISSETFESVLALYQRDQDAFYRGLGAG